jgi:serine/threonine protein kinase
MGVVWRAHDLALDREVAIKFLKPERAGDAAAAERFVTESRITGQLQHPGIPAVHELGTLPDGRPFLAMKLIRGRTLQDLLKSRDASLSRDREGAADPAERGRFIAIFEQVCHAVGYAHAHKVIHRDLKPSNVMVGEFGEVQVMDWGLAKVLTPSRDRQGAAVAAAAHASRQRQEAAEFPGVQPVQHREMEPATDERATETLVPVGGVPERGDWRTRAGSVLGTPAYMPPEQARGEIDRLDARSDVFGLGATLCHILTGQPPYRAEEREEVLLQAVRWEVAEAFAALDSCGAEPELVALCKRCLAREQADRPADGRAVAAEVARIRQAAEERARQAELERQRAVVRAAEQAKRRRLAVLLGSTIAAVLLIGLAVSVWQMWRAISAEQQVRQERDAKDAALKAETAARQAEKQARERAMAALRMMTDDLVENRLARGAVLSEEDREFLREVIEHYQGLASITADDADSRSIRAEGLFRVGRMRHRLGDLADAEAAYRDGLALFKELAAEFPNRPDFRHDLAKSHNNLGILLETTGRLAEAEASYRDALTLEKQLVDEFPMRSEFRQELASSHHNLGVLLRAAGRLAEAMASYREALALRKHLVADYPTRPDFRQALGHSHNNLGNVLSDAGRLAEAEASYRDALALFKQLASDFPTRPDFRQELASCCNNLGALLYETGRLAEAEAAYREALALRQQLADDFPIRPDFRQDLALSHNN